MAKKAAAKNRRPPRTFETEEEFVLYDDYERKKRFVPTVPTIANVVSKLMSKRGYAQIQTTASEREVWNKIAGPSIAAHSRPGKIRGSVWEILVRNSVLVQELSFQHSQLVQKLKQAQPETKVKSLKFKVGPID